MPRSKTYVFVVALSLILLILFSACSGGQPAEVTTDSPTQMVESEPEDEHVEDEAEDHDEGEAENDDEDEEHDEGMDEHVDEGEDAGHEHLEVPSAYATLTNPFAGDQDAITAGADLFATTCASCHGETGLGDGPAAIGLDPQPASLADAEMMADMSDGYIFWRIAEGGTMEPFNSAMPPWESALSEEQIWQLVSFLRTLPGE